MTVEGKPRPHDTSTFSVNEEAQQWTFAELLMGKETEKSLLTKSIKEPYGDASIAVFTGSGKELRKSLGYVHAFACIVSTLFGSGIFISPSLVARKTSNMGIALIVWVLSGIPCLLGALCFCELACMYKKTGSYYLFVLKAYGKVLAFMIIFVQIIIIAPAGFAVIALAIGEHLTNAIPNIEESYKPWLVKTIGILVVISATGMNYISAAFVGRVQIFFSVTQTLSALFLVVLGIIQVASGHVENYTVMFNNSTEAFDIGRFGLALYNGLWAYDGWGGTVSVAEEMHNLNMDLWLSLVTGIPFVTVCYVFINLALMSALTKNEITRSGTVATVFVTKVLGRKASYIIPVAVAMSCFGGLSMGIFTTSRTIMSAAREEQLPSLFSYIHKDRRTPIPSLLFICVLTIIWILPSANTIQALIIHFSIAAWLKYGLAILSVLVMRKRKPDLERPFKVWIANPIFTSLFSLLLIIVPFIKHPIESTVTLLLFLTALPVYYVFIKKNYNLPYCVRNITTGLASSLRRRWNLAPCTFKENANVKYADDKS